MIIYVNYPIINNTFHNIFIYGNLLLNCLFFDQNSKNIVEYLLICGILFIYLY